jgi:hypothetical protein
MVAYDIGVADIYFFSAFSSADAERIVAATGKKPRHDFDQTAETLNWALTLAIALTSAAQAAPANKQRARTKRLQSVLGQALQLMGLSTKHPPFDGRDFAPAYAVLLPAGKSDSCARLGFSSPEDAIWLGIRCLWLLQRYAAAARAHWEAHPEKTRHKPDPLVMAWAATMVDTYVKVVDAERPKFPTTESPLIRFCEAMRVHLLKRAGSTNEPPFRAFRATLNRVRPAPMAAFISRHLSRAPQQIRRSTRSNSHRRIRRQRRPK